MSADSTPGLNKPVAPPRRRAPGRLAPLSVLPVFVPLDGRPALLAGGGEGGAWKAELLAAAGAKVLILAPDPCEEMLELVGRGASAGGLTLERRWWTPADIAAARLALLDTECEAEAASFLAIGRAVGTTINVIDKPEHCDIQFGSIVNRSPVVVSISTDGAAPILGQAIRQRIEAMLPA
ncbi:MAG: NAD(P)-dependent oxidoreductase, partial [Pseudomonadota bacterium]